MTSVQKIIEQIDKEVQVLSNLYGSEIKGRLIALAFAKKRCLEMLEMEKQQIIDAWNSAGGGDAFNIGDDYYTSTYGSKGSDDHIVDTNKMVDQVPDVRKMVDDDKETFLLWVRRNYERCKTGWIDLETGNKHRIEPDLVYEYYQLHPTFSQTEISDEEIEKAAETFWPKANESSLIRCWILGAKWYREQLKQRQ